MAKVSLHFQRFEFKYYLPKNKADKLIPVLLNYMNWDPYILETGNDFYEVNSLYFDSPDFGCFSDKESGISKRKKLRFRFYNNQVNYDTPVFAEIKRKDDALVIKDRVKLNGSDCFNSSFDNKLNYLLKEDVNNAFLQELIWFKRRNSMQPKIFVSYKRKALVSKTDERFRVTFDYDIKTQLTNDLKLIPNRLEDIYPTGVVLEVKYNNIMPVWFHRIIQQYQLQRLTYSKFCNSVRKVMPQFDDNNYSII